MSKYPATNASEAPRGPLEPSNVSERARTLTRWSLLMIPATALSMLAAFFVGTALMHATGTPEGALLTSKGVAGWISWFAVNLVSLSAPLTGIFFALAARREGDTDRSRLALMINALLGGFMIVSAVVNLFG